jgi:CHAD domain-containing protein
LDVFLLKLDEYERVLGQGSATALAPLRNLLQKERRTEHAKLIRTLKTKRYQRFRHDWGGLLDDARTRPAGSVRREAPIHEAADRAIWRMYRRVRKQSRLVADVEHMEPIHELRKECKQLRYLIEAFQMLYPAKPLRQAINELKALQDALGDLCDIFVQSGLLTAWGNKVKPMHDGDAALEHALDKLKRTISKRGQDLFAKLSVQLERFNGTSNRRLYRRVFRPG